MFAGERYDIVLEANNTAGTYAIHVKGLATCVKDQVYQLGVLQYGNTVTTQNAVPHNPGYNGFALPADYRIMNPENATCSTGSGGICITELVNSNPVPQEILNQLPDFNFILTFGFQLLDTKTLFETYDRYFVSPELDLLSSIMNNISFESPPAPPLTQPEDVPPEALCPLGTDGLVPQCPGGESYCMCTNVIKIPLGAIVQIILSDETPRSDLNHPFHLHGYAFYVMDMGQYQSGQTARDLLTYLQKNVTAVSSAPPLKDTIAVPSGGYTVIKFKAENPGYWFFHCHFEYHLATGMAVVLQVGEKSDFPSPPAGFPKCGSFTPQVYIS